MEKGHAQSRTIAEAGPHAGGKPCRSARLWSHVVLQEANLERVHLPTQRTKRHHVQSLRGAGPLRRTPHVLLPPHVGRACGSIPRRQTRCRARKSERPQAQACLESEERSEECLWLRGLVPYSSLPKIDRDTPAGRIEGDPNVLQDGVTIFSDGTLGRYSQTANLKHGGWGWCIIDHSGTVLLAEYGLLEGT